MFTTRSKQRRASRRRRKNFKTTSKVHCLRHESLEDRTLLTAISILESTFFGGAGDQRGTEVEIQGSDIFVSVNANETQSPSASSFLVKYSAPTGPSTTPGFSRSWALGTLNGIAVDGSNVYGAGFSHPGDGLTNDGTGGTEVKTLLTNFDANNVSGAGPGGSNWAATIPQGTFNTGPGTSFFSYNGVENYLDAIAVDDGGNTFVYTVGHAQPCSHTTFVVGKYDSAGNVLAGATAASVNFNTCTAPNDAKGNVFGLVELNGSVYTAGGIGDTSGVGFPTVWKYDKNLNVQWKNQDTAGISGGDFYGVATDGTSVFAVGATRGADTNYIIAKYDQAGTQLWRTISDGGGTTDYLRDVTVVGGRMFATGYTNAPGAGGEDMVILEIDPTTGAVLSTDTYGGAQNDRGNRLTTDGTDLYVIGESRSFAEGGNSVGQNDAVLLRYSISATPASLWNGDGNADDTVGGNNGSLHGGVTFTTGRTGQAFNFNGSSSYVSIPDHPSLRPPSFTIGGWFNFPANPSGTQDLAANYGGQSGGLYDGWILEIGPDLKPYLQVARQPNLIGGATSLDPIPVNQWVYIAGTYDGTNVNLYVDGDLKGTGNFPGGYTVSGGAMTIGKASWYSGRYFAGSADEVSFYDRALSAAEIQSLANGTANQFINNEPLFTAGDPPAVNEDAGAQTVDGWATFDPGAANESGQTATYTVNHVSNLSLFSAVPAVGANGNLTYTPADNANGTSTFEVQVQDDGGTANGGDDTSQTQTFTITVNAINDEPSFVAGADENVLEDSGSHTIVGWATAISPGPADESGQTLSFIIDSNSNPGLFTVGPAVDAARGDLTYTLAADANGSASIGVKLSDDGGAAPLGLVGYWQGDGNADDALGLSHGAAQSGTSFVAGKLGQAFHMDGTGNGVRISPSASVHALSSELTISMWAKWDTLPGTHDWTMLLTKDSIYRAFGVGFQADGSLLRFAHQGLTNQTSPTTFTPTVGTWYHLALTFDSTLGSNQAKIYVDGSLAAEATQTGTIATNASDIYLGYDLGYNGYRFQGSLDEVALFNQALSAIDVANLYQADGNAQPGLDSVIETFNINVSPVNDVPSFTMLGDQTVNEDSGSHIVSRFATAAPGGGPDEASQTFTYTVVNNNPSLFAVAPAIDTNGQLTFTPAVDESGAAIVTVTVKDSGGTDYGGTDTSSAQTFEVEVLPAQTQVANLIDDVLNDLVANGPLNNGQGNALTSKLQNAIDKLVQPNPNINAAINKLNTFINQLQGWVPSKLTQAEAQPFIDAANAAIASALPGSPLLAISVGGQSATSIGHDAMVAASNHAIDFWREEGATTEQLDLLRATPIYVAQLPGHYLGAASRTAGIWLDRDAAGHGWYVGVDGTSEVGSQVDLFSVLTHEMGHVLRYDHDHHDAVMAPTLSPGQSHLSRPEVDGIAVDLPRMPLAGSAHDSLFSQIGVSDALQPGGNDLLSSSKLDHAAFAYRSSQNANKSRLNDRVYANTLDDVFADDEDELSLLLGDRAEWRVDTKSGGSGPPV